MTEPRVALTVQYRRATAADAGLLARMNRQLILDEGHRNRMSDDELLLRMQGWLAAEYRAVLFEDEEGPAGYALYRDDDEFVYLRQLFVVPERRRKGVGRAAIEWLLENVWAPSRRIRIDVLAGNLPAIQFWRSLGFAEYCTTMERAVETS